MSLRPPVSTTDNKNVPVNGSISASVPSSVSFPQPNLFAVSNGHDSRPEASSYVSPVDITGHLFEQYRRARCTGTLGPLTPQSGEQNHQICGRARFAQQSTPDWAHSSTRPASFHPVLPQRDEICQPQAHHNPYAYQNHRSSSDLGDGDRTSDNRNPYNPTPPQSIRSESVPGVAGPRVAESSRTNSIMCESLYDYPPSLSPYPCPTFNPETEAIGRVKARASSLLPPTRKRVPRPASIDPFLLLAPGSRATKPPPRPDPSDSGYQLTSRGHNHSTDRCGQPSVFTDRELGPSNGNSTVKNTPTTVPVFNFKPSSSVASEEQTCTLSSPLLHPIYPNFGRPQSGDSSSAICQVGN
ncbi:unnamed protein product [Echinostoma caproni]|uniref:Uncharacterized protein n=1 Tax=Echinostoma caproni TaxID=27848 RepID=A0A183ARJ2_9TREM|nr:unnamed protein product [Echinostoma caproni]